MNSLHINNSFSLHLHYSSPLYTCEKKIQRTEAEIATKACNIVSTNNPLMYELHQVSKGDVQNST